MWKKSCLKNLHYIHPLGWMRRSRGWGIEAIGLYVVSSLVDHVNRQVVDLIVYLLDIDEVPRCDQR